MHEDEDTDAQQVLGEEDLDAHRVQKERPAWLRPALLAGGTIAAAAVFVVAAAAGGSEGGDTTRLEVDRAELADDVDVEDTSTTTAVAPVQTTVPAVPATTTEVAPGAPPADDAPAAGPLEAPATTVPPAPAPPPATAPPTSAAPAIDWAAVSTCLWFKPNTTEPRVESLALWQTYSGRGTGGPGDVGLAEQIAAAQAVQADLGWGAIERSCRPPGV